MSDDKEKYATSWNLMNIPMLQRSRVMILGAGRMGANVAMELAENGVSTKPPGLIDIYDDDIVEDKNVRAGTPFFQSHVGRSKVECLTELMLQKNSAVNVNYYKIKITVQNITEIEEKVKHRDIVCWFIDDFEVIRAGIEKFHPFCIQIWAGFGRNVDFGEVCFSLPKSKRTLAVTMGCR